MTEVFDKLKAKLAETGTLTDGDLGESSLTDDERIWLSAERFSKQHGTDNKITMDAYLEASKKLDTLPEGSPEYDAALKIVEEYERQT